MSRRGTPPQGRVDNHDHSDAGRGGDYLAARSQDVTGSRVTDVGVEGFVQRREALPLALSGEVASGFLSGSDDIAIAGNTAFVPASTSNTLVSIDISNPQGPAILQTLDVTATDTARAVAIAGPFAYVAAFGNDSLTSIDISNPSSMSVTDTATHADLTEPEDVGISGDHAFVMNHADMVVSVDISDPADLSVSGSLQPPSASEFASIQVRGDYAYLAEFGNDGVIILDVSDPANMREVGFVSDSSLLSDVWSVTVRRDIAYVATQGSDTMVTIDVTDEKSPSILDSIDTTAAPFMGSATSTLVRGDYAYVSAGGHITVVDIRDPENISRLATSADHGISNILSFKGFIIGTSANAISLVGESGPLDSGTVTATGGSTPAVDTTLNNVRMNQTDPHDVIVYVDATPTFGADYAFNYDWGFRWDSANVGGNVDINLTVNWDVDPGGGNDVTLRWEIVRP